MTELTESERAELNERLARAMGIPDDRWTFQCLKEDHLLDGHGPHAFCLTCAAPVNKSALVPPDFTRDLAASRELVEWMAAQDAAGAFFFGSFLYHLEKALISAGVHMGGTINRQREFMTAPPLLIAQAADAATKGEG